MAYEYYSVDTHRVFTNNVGDEIRIIAKIPNAEFPDYPYVGVDETGKVMMFNKRGETPMSDGPEFHYDLAMPLDTKGLQSLNMDDEVMYMYHPFGTWRRAHFHSIGEDGTPYVWRNSYSSKTAETDGYGMHIPDQIVAAVAIRALLDNEFERCWDNGVVEPMCFTLGQTYKNKAGEDVKLISRNERHILGTTLDRAGNVTEVSSYAFDGRNTRGGSNLKRPKLVWEVSPSDIFVPSGSQLYNGKVTNSRSQVHHFEEREGKGLVAMCYMYHSTEHTNHLYGLEEITLTVKEQQKYRDMIAAVPF